MGKLITLEERKKIIEKLDSLEDEEFIELIRKLMESYNLIYATLSEKIRENKKAYLSELRYDELKIKYAELNTKYNEKNKKMKKIRK